MLDDLMSYTRKELLEMAKTAGFSGISRHTKDQLVEILASGSGKEAEAKPASNPHDLNSLLKEELVAMAVKAGHKGVSRYTRTQLVTLLSEREHGSIGSSEGLLGEGEQKPAPAPYVAAAQVPTAPVPPWYGRNRLTLLVRDPYWLHAYWEIRQDTLDEARARCHGEGRFVVRLFDISEHGDHPEAAPFKDVDVNGNTPNWYIHSQRPGGSFYAQVGLLDAAGNFHLLAQSERVTSPRNVPTEVEDEEWMSLEGGWEQIYTLSGGRMLGAGSLELREMIERRFHEEVSSGSVTSFSGGGGYSERQRGFWFVLNTELVVYGATDPAARVSVQGKPIELRPDGTFTLRFALPDGQQVIPVEAISPDGVEARTITPRVAKSTTYAQVDKMSA